VTHPLATHMFVTHSLATHMFVTHSLANSSHVHNRIPHDLFIRDSFIYDSFIPDWFILDSTVSSSLIRDLFIRSWLIHSCVTHVFVTHSFIRDTFTHDSFIRDSLICTSWYPAPNQNLNLNLYRKIPRNMSHERMNKFTNSNKSKISIWICTARYRGIWVAQFCGFWGCSIVSGKCRTGSHYVYNGIPCDF